MAVNKRLDFAVPLNRIMLCPHCSFPAEEAYIYLRSLPGVGLKSALCVMMYSLGLDVFPVDARVHRVLCRVGLINRGAKHYDAQAMLPGFVRPGRSK